MLEAIKFDQMVADESLKELCYAVPGGTLAGVVSSRQEENDLLVRLLLGLAKPVAGSVAVLGQDVGNAPEKALVALRRQVAVLFPTGGLVSNLKVWENLVLPLEYHFDFSQEEIEERGMAALRRVGYAGGLMELPGHLSLYQRRQVGLARAMLTDPRLVIYNAMLDGLSQGEKAAMTAAALEFHRESEQRTSLFMTPNQETIKEIPLDSRILIKGSSTSHD